MKRKLLTTILAVTLSLTSTINLTACGGDDTHVHDYNLLKYDESKHWYECSCGERNGEGSHTGGTATVSQKAVCSVCSQEYGELVNPHTFNQQVVDEKYLKSPATCEEKAKYYYSCECGESGTEYFEHGEKLGHAYGEMVSNGNGRHVQTCANDSSHTLIARCSGGTATCDKKAVCTVCGGEYGSTIPHDFAKFNFCKNCYGVYTDMTKSVVELGIPTLLSYKEKDISNCAWDTHYYNGKIYRGCGDYAEDSKAVTIWAYDVEKEKWSKEYVTSDVAVQRFVEVDGKLMAPGTDPTGSWSYGNCYELDENGWTTNSKVPNGVHMFDVIEYDGKVFYGLGVNYKQTPLNYTENGVDYTSVYFYKNGVKLDLSQSAQGLSPARVYELFTFKNDLYAYLIYQGVYSVYKYDGTNMVCVNEEAYYGQFNGNYNVFVADFERGDTFYMVSGAIYAIQDLSNAFEFERYTPTSTVNVSDAIYRDGKYYLLCYEKTAVNGKYKTIIYESETMAKNSFTEVVSFDYEITPLTFDKVGDDFYVSMGGRNSTASTKNGMLLKVKAN